jgi:hypothetical protein
MKRYIYIFSLLMLLLLSCSKSSTDLEFGKDNDNLFDFGIEQDGYYINDYFDFRIKKTPKCKFQFFRYSKTLRRAEMDFESVYNESEKREKLLNYKRFVKKSKIKNSILLTMRTSYLEIYIKVIKKDTYKSLDDIALKFEKDINKIPSSTIVENKRTFIGGKEFLLTNILSDPSTRFSIKKNYVYLDAIIKDYIFEIRFEYKDLATYQKFQELLSHFDFNG